MQDAFLYLFQSHPVGQIGIFAWPILASKPYVWHLCFQLFAAIGEESSYELWELTSH